jgi:ATP-dependent Clp protease ATP-binding subunit ClpA
VFDFIREEAGKAILKAQVDKIVRRLEEQKNIRVTVTDEAYAELSAAALNDLSNGGRGVGNQVEALLINPLSRWLFDNSVIENADVTIEHFDTNVQPPCVQCHTGSSKEAADHD